MCKTYPQVAEQCVDKWIKLKYPLAKALCIKEFENPQRTVVSVDNCGKLLKQKTFSLTVYCRTFGKSRTKYNYLWITLWINC